MAFKRHISLLWSDAVLSGQLPIDISPLCGEDRLLIRTLGQHKRFFDVISASRATFRNSRELR